MKKGQPDFGQAALFFMELSPLLFVLVLVLSAAVLVLEIRLPTTPSARG
jgi:hypothetical protein